MRLQVLLLLVAAFIAACTPSEQQTEGVLLGQASPDPNAPPILFITFSVSDTDGQYAICRLSVESFDQLDILEIVESPDVFGIMASPDAFIEPRNPPIYQDTRKGVCGIIPLDQGGVSLIDDWRFTISNVGDGVAYDVFGFNLLPGDTLSFGKLQPNPRPWEGEDPPPLANQA